MHERIRVISNRPAHPGVLRVLRNALGSVLSRTLRHGPASGALAFRVLAENTGIKLCNRLTSDARVTCPCCHWSGYAFRTFDFGRGLLRNLECPRCGAHDRQRMFHLMFERGRLEFVRQPGRVLHAAPEMQVRAHIAAPDVRRIEMDINPDCLSDSSALRTVCDLMHLPFAENSLDAAILLHVMEHVVDDRAVFRELARALRPGGTAIVMVPVYLGMDQTDDWGFPDPQVFDHYRTYAVADFPERAAPLQVTMIHPRDVLSAEEQARYAIRDTEVIFLCRAG